MSDVTFDPSQTIWVEKYRPQRISEVVMPERIKQTFSTYARDGDFPSLLLSGGPGIGKTTVAKALCQELGMDFILVNASNERGIDTLRTTITSFATSVSFSDVGLKCVIMDEFDASSDLLQKAMRAAIEDFSRTCRFIFTCNYPNRIIDAIHSRCASVDLAMQPSEKAAMAAEIMKRCREILKIEGVKYETPALAEVVKKFFPDFRRVLNELQRLAQATGSIDSETVKGTFEDVNITKLIKHLQNKDFVAMRAWVGSNSHNDFNSMFRQIYDNLSNLLQHSSIPEAVVILAQYQYRGVTAPDPEINMVAFLTEMMATVKFKE